MTKHAPSKLARYRQPIIAACVVIIAVTIGLLIWSQKKSQEYDEAFKKGMTAWEQRQMERAVSELRKAAKLDPRYPELWVMIGRAELASGHADRALEAWEEALRREPGYKPARFERGKEALDRHVARRIPPPVDASAGWLPLRLESADRVQGGTEEQQRIVADLREGAPHSPEFLKFARGAIFLLDGKYKDAQPALQAYADANNWDAAAIALLGIAGHYATLSKAAEKALSEALALRNEKPWLKVRADARYLQGNYEGARADYREAGLEKEAEPLFERRVPSQGLVVWLKSDAGVDLTESSVSRWQDQSSGKNDAAPREAAVGPRVTASAVNKRPAILFSGKEDELRLPDGFEDLGAGLSMFVVGEPPPEPSEPWSFLLLATGMGAGRTEAFIGRRRDVDQIVYSAEDLVPQRKPYVAGIPPAKGFEGICAIQESSGAVRLYRRGSLVASGELTLPRKILRTRNRVGVGLKGHVAEVLLYRRSLSELERLGIEAYLKDRYFPEAGAAAPTTEKR